MMTAAGIDPDKHVVPVENVVEVVWVPMGKVGEANMVPMENVVEVGVVPMENVVEVGAVPMESVVKVIKKEEIITCKKKVISMTILGEGTGLLVLKCFVKKLYNLCDNDYFSINRYYCILTSFFVYFDTYDNRNR